MVEAIIVQWLEASKKTVGVISLHVHNYYYVQCMHVACTQSPLPACMDGNLIHTCKEWHGFSPTFQFHSIFHPARCEIKPTVTVLW